jgi:ABC-type enterochelin transport system substrate-binding protein
MEWGDETISKLAMDTQQFTTFGQIYDQMTKQQADAEKATAALDGQIKQIEAKMPKQGGQGGLPPISPYMDAANDLPA